MTMLERFARERPITLFLVIVFGLGYPLLFLPTLLVGKTLPPESLLASVGLDVEKTSILLMMFLALLPAAVIVTALEGGRPAVNALFRRATRWRVGAGWWAIILLALPVSTIVLALLLGDTWKTPTIATLRAELVGLAIGFFLVNLWEETAWAGFLQTRLERRHNLYAAAALTAVPFAAIHMPLQVINGVTAPLTLAGSFVALMILGLVFRSMAGLVLRGTGNSLFAVGFIHTMFNRSNNTDGIAARLLEGGHRQVAALVATLGLTVILGVALRARATRAERTRLDAADGDGLPGAAASGPTV